MLGAVLRRVERGDRLPTDPSLLVIHDDSPHGGAVCAFTGMTVVSGPLTREWVESHLPADDLSAPLCPPFLTAICEHLRRRVNNVDIVLLGPRASEAQPNARAPRLVEHIDHPRVRRARRYRDDVRVYATDAMDGVLIIGRGLGGRWEVAVEVDPRVRGRGVGRSLAAAAPALVPDDRPIWAQIAPGNAASVRAFLAAGFRPVGAEALLVPLTG